MSDTRTLNYSIPEHMCCRCRCKCMRNLCFICITVFCAFSKPIHTLCTQRAIAAEGLHRNRTGGISHSVHSFIHMSFSPIFPFYFFSSAVFTVLLFWHFFWLRSYSEFCIDYLHRRSDQFRKEITQFFSVYKILFTKIIIKKFNEFYNCFSSILL